GAPLSPTPRAGLRAARRVGRHRCRPGPAVPRAAQAHVPGGARLEHEPGQRVRRSRAAFQLPDRPRREPGGAGPGPASVGQPRGTRARRGNARAMTGESLGVAVAFSAGLFSFLSPCVLPLFPSYVSFITGMSVADLTTDLTPTARRRVLIHAVAFVLGFSLVFVALGASFSAAGQFLLDYREWIRRIGGALILIFRLFIVGGLPVGFFCRPPAWAPRPRPAGHLRPPLGGLPFPAWCAPCLWATF